MTRDSSLWVIRFSPHQIPIAKSFPGHASHHLPHLVDGVQRTHVVTAGKLIDVALKVFLTHTVIGAVVAPFQERPEGLNAVGVGLAFDVLPDAVTDGSVLEIQTEPIVTAVIVCVDR